MIFFLVSASVPIDMRAPFRPSRAQSLRGAPGPVHRGTMVPRPLDGVLPPRCWAGNRETLPRRRRRHPIACDARAMRMRVAAVLAGLLLTSVPQAVADAPAVRRPAEPA